MAQLYFLPSKPEIENDVISITINDSANPKYTSQHHSYTFIIKQIIQKKKILELIDLSLSKFHDISRN